MNPENIAKAKQEYNDELYYKLLDNLLPERPVDAKGEGGYTKMGQGDIMFNLELAD